MSQGLSSFKIYKPAVEAELQAFMVRAPKLFNVELSQQIQQAFEHLREYALRPSKRLRGSLAAMAYDVAAGTISSKQGAKLGAALELLQNYLLIVDDVMDKSALRRGQPTLQKLYEPESINHGGEHEANMLAVNVGLVAQHLANLLLLEIDVAPELLSAAMRILHLNISVTGFGQIDDLYQQIGRDVTEADVIRKYTLKSSFYTFVNPLQLGFALAGKGDVATLSACEAYGVPAGIAFQLHDDFLGIFGQGEETGKSNLDDMREGKYTLLVAYAMHHANAEQAARLRQLLGNPTASEVDLQTLRQLLTDTGAKDYCAQEAKQYAAHAKQQLANGGIGSPELTTTLGELLDYVITREK